MPAFYAHHSFGERVFAHLEGELKNTIDNNRPLFDIGLQGPDLFFFYKPYSTNAVNKYGNALHGQSVKPFMEKASEIIQEKGRNSAEYAYLLGFVCHFILDSECHPYIDKMIGKTGVSHIEIEEEFEKHMLRLDGRDPLGYPVWRLVPDKSAAKSIVPFFEVTVTDVEKSLAWLRLVKRLFTAPSPIKQAVLNSAMKAVGQYDKYMGLMNQIKDNPACAEVNAALEKRLYSAVDVAAAMIESLDESIRTGGEVNERLDRTFL
ncbi:MAG: zinc dependent phospholipase C family protein [Clostridiales bacterium]|nr:zinc dependent phospholipase C family protein [Clostridiales bacterium]